MQLRLPRSDALLPATPDKLLNRLVRPLLGALTRASGVPARYFGRDWVSVEGSPVALVAFGHEAASGRCLFEAIAGVRTSIAASARASFLGKPARTLEEVAGKAVDPAEVAAAIAAAYAKAASEVRPREPEPFVSGEKRVEAQPPWSAMREEAIGPVGAGPDASGKLRVGGELMASRDAIARLEDLAGALPPDAGVDDVGRVVDDVFGDASGRGALLFGVRSLGSIRDVLVEARQNMACSTLEK
jgi:hypothetical protein